MVLGERGERKPGPQDIGLWLAYWLSIARGAKGKRQEWGRERRADGGGVGRRAGDGGARVPGRVFKLRNASSSSRDSRPAPATLSSFRTTTISLSPALLLSHATMTTTQFDRVYHGLSPEVGSLCFSPVCEMSGFWAQSSLRG